MAAPAPRRSPSSPIPFSRSAFFLPFEVGAAAELWGQVRQYPVRRSLRGVRSRINQKARFASAFAPLRRIY
jgi:hypothetical protein